MECKKSLAARRLLFLSPVAVVAIAALLILAIDRPGEARLAGSQNKNTVPRIVDPGPPGGPPSDAIVLFDGKDLSAWRGPKGEPSWKVEDGVLTIDPGEGSLTTRRAFGDIQFHIEWRVPADARGKSESRGNSGIKFHEAYEIQILDSYQNRSRPTGQAGAVYAQTPPLVNACRKPGEWQTYDIVFRSPRFDVDGKRLEQGTFTVFHNGVLVQDRTKIQGRTNSPRRVKPDYKQPLFLQAHGSLVNFRNIWVRELEREKP